MRAILAPPVVCVLTRARGTTGSAERNRLLDRIAGMAAAGATMIQVRERNLDDRQLLAFIEELKGTVAGTSTLVTVNDRVDLALAAGADGVHLKSDAPSVRDVRSVVGPHLMVGRSIHSVEEARSAQADGGCDYVLFGTVYRSASKPDTHPIAGVDGLAAVCRAVSVPVLAIGGITVSRAAEIRAAGAAGIAAISLFAEAQDPASVVEALRRALTPSEPDV